jgi:hypothetical protein
MSGTRLRDQITGHRATSSSMVTKEVRFHGGFWLAVSEYLATQPGTSEAVDAIGRVVGREEPGRNRRPQSE